MGLVRTTEEFEAVNRRSQSTSSGSTSATLVENMALQSGTWQGNLPCVCGHNGGCRLHNPKSLEIFHNEQLPIGKNNSPKLLERLFRTYRTPQKPEVVKCNEPILLKQPLNRAVADPLDPIHKSIHYHLAWYHINWLRQNNEKDPKDLGKVSTLTCGQYGEGRPDLFCTSQPYWIDKSLFLCQTVLFKFEMDKTHRKEKKICPTLGLIFNLQHELNKWRFQCCPHRQHVFIRCTLVETRGIVSATVTYLTKTMRMPRSSAWTTAEMKWDSNYGFSHHHYWTCRHCYKDSVIRIELADGRVHVKVEVYKDLGSGSDPYDKKWLAALRGWNAPNYKCEMLLIDREDEKTVPVYNAVCKATKAKTDLHVHKERIWGRDYASTGMIYGK
ncbi:hypothetical protein HD806DRAFT_543289 [Xylariaceae sp. AK1471]|nr:hypothetical protein HD806DRAFT_543289 [Xylariaceae sp. AK1471]